MFFQGYYDDDQFNSHTYSLQLKWTSQKFLALSGIHSSHFQQSNRTTVIDVKQDMPTITEQTDDADNSIIANKHHELQCYLPDNPDSG